MLHANATTFTTQPALPARSHAGSSLDLIGRAAGKGRAALMQIEEALRLDRAPYVDRERQNERVYDRLGDAERLAQELVDAIFAARRAVAPAEEA